MKISQIKFYILLIAFSAGALLGDSQNEEVKSCEVNQPEIKLPEVKLQETGRVARFKEIFKSKIDKAGTWIRNNPKKSTALISAGCLLVLNLIIGELLLRSRLNEPGNRKDYEQKYNFLDKILLRFYMLPASVYHQFLNPHIIEPLVHSKDRKSGDENK